MFMFKSDREISSSVAVCFNVREIHTTASDENTDRKNHSVGDPHPHVD
ncbi:MAG: hypothetical protein LBH38_00460 [Holosporales bacterium]|jgi:hypothetical protein|nr:hypothetical protein [Holosporales bacterium]